MHSQWWQHSNHQVGYEEHRQACNSGLHQARHVRSTHQVGYNEHGQACNSGLAIVYQTRHVRSTHQVGNDEHGQACVVKGATVVGSHSTVPNR